MGRNPAWSLGVFLVLAIPARADDPATAARRPDLRAVEPTGFTLSGTVTDQDGRPIEGAVVVWRAVGREAPEVRAKSGPGGRFQFENRPPGTSMVTADAPGLATDLKLVDLGPPDPNRPTPMLYGFPFVVTNGPEVDMAIEPSLPADFSGDVKQIEKGGPCEPPLVLRLGPGRTIRGRVVDRKGRPIAGVRVTPELMGRSDLLGWRAETGPDGRFRWTNAPRNDIVLKLEDPAELQTVRLQAPPEPDREIVVKMPVPFRLRGNVVDAETGRPLESFRLIEGDVWTHDFQSEEDQVPPDWSAGRARTIAGGRYEVRFPRSGRLGEGFDYSLLMIRVEAEGYAPAVSKKYGIWEGEQTCNFALRKHPWIKGIVRAADGSPVAGAEVVAAVEGGPAPGFYNGRLAKGWRGDVVRTGPDGRFGLPRPEAAGRVVVVSDRGQARRTPDELAARPEVTLEPWGSIRGQVRVGTSVGARRLVSATLAALDDRGKPIAYFSARTPADSEGRFVLEGVPPGHAMVYRPSWSGDGTMLRSHRQGVEVASGRPAEVIVGGAGRPVVGRVTRSAGLPSFDLSAVAGQLQLQQPAPDVPEGFDEWGPERQRAWWYEFYVTAEGRAYNERANAYAVKLQPDGSFRLDDVPEGRYCLTLEYVTTHSPPNAPEAAGTSRRVAVLEAYLDVPAGPDDKPIDLGTLTLTPPEPETVDR